MKSVYVTHQYANSQDLALGEPKPAVLVQPCSAKACEGSRREAACSAPVNLEMVSKMEVMAAREWCAV